MLTNREIATLILLCAMISLALCSKTVRAGLPGVYRSVTNSKVLIVIGIYIAYSVAVIVAAGHFGFWNAQLLKDTLIAILITGMGTVMQANTVKSGSSLVKKTLLNVLGIGAIITFYVNLSSFSIPLELVLQATLGLVSVLSVVAKYQKDTPRSATKFFDILLFVGGAVLLAKTTADLHNVWHTEGASGIFEPLALSILFPVALLPFIYILSFIMYLETMLMGLKMLNDRKRINITTLLALLLGLRFSVRYASVFSGKWRMDFLEKKTFGQKIIVMRDFRREIQSIEAKKRLEAKLLKKYAGVEGVDENGKRFDRREFKETCKVLTDLYFYQRGMLVNRGHYFEEPLILLNDSKYYGFDRHVDLGVTAYVAKNKRSWYAWRRTITGWVFAIGGTKDSDEQWRYDGPIPPSGYPPSNKNDQWTKDESVNWSS